MRSCRPSPKERLIALLEKEGFRVDRLSSTQGYWRKMDVARWEGSGWRFFPELGKEDRVNWSCMDTMTKCARKGIVWSATIYPRVYEIYANESEPVAESE